MNNSKINPNYQVLIEAATEVLRKNYHPLKHSVGAAILGASGRIYTGINIESSGFGVCAEPVALGAALANGERNLTAIVAVAKRESGFIVLSPCGNCRQMILDYASEANVVYADENGIAETKAKNLLPGAYVSPDFAEI